MIPLNESSSSPKTVCRSELDEYCTSAGLVFSSSWKQEVFHASGQLSLRDLSGASYLHRVYRDEGDLVKGFNSSHDESLLTDLSSSSFDEEEVVLPAVLPSPSSSTSTSTSTSTNNSGRIAPSCLRTSPCRGRAAVRGLWLEANDCTTAALSDNLLKTVFAHLGVEDVVTCEAVSQRWQTVASDPELWRTADVSTFIAETYGQMKTKYCKHTDEDPAVRTTQHLTRLLQTHEIEQLTMNDIGTSLSADFLHIPFWKLERLTITNFEGLTDTHIRSLLFLATLRTKKLPLRSIRLVECDKVTQNSLLAIRTLCPDAACVLITQEDHDDLQQHLVLQTTTQRQQEVPMVSLFVGSSLV